MIPGIKVDMGLQPLPGGHPVETWCTGLDGLVDRAKKYYAQGARFAKWRAVLQVRSHCQAEYADAGQQCGVKCAVLDSVAS